MKKKKNKNKKQNLVSKRTPHAIVKNKKRLRCTDFIVLLFD